MADDRVQVAVDKLAGRVTLTARREIEKAVRHALKSGKIKPGDTVPASISLVSEKVDLQVTVHSVLEL